jgi:probable F420-dependent oxidoreductase
MKFGAYMFPTDYAIDVVELGKAVEERGFESFFVPEHTHIPTSRRTPFPRGGELPKEYSHTLDPFVALGAVAAATQNIKLGTGICLVVERDPITLAKEVASLDFISNGRFLFGIGGGWNREEMENHGTDPTKRWAVLRERVEAMKQIWTNDEAEYHGQYVNFDKIWQWPKPIQKPHPPILVGGDAPNTLKRVVAYGDGWLPNSGRSPASLGRKLEELSALAAEAGRKPPPVSLFGVALDIDRQLLEGYQELGVERCIFKLPPAPAEEVLPLLDQAAQIAERFS